MQVPKFFQPKPPQFSGAPAGPKHSIKQFLAERPEIDPEGLSRIAKDIGVGLGIPTNPPQTDKLILRSNKPGE